MLVVGLALQSQISIVAIQDDGLPSNEQKSFLKYCEHLNFRAYHAPGITIGNQVFGGAMLLVDTRLRSVELAQMSEPESQSVSVIINDVVLNFSVSTAISAREYHSLSML